VAGDRIQLALRALPLAQLDRRDDVAATLAACFVARREQRPLFDEAFAMFWRDPAWLTAMPGGDEASAEGGAAAERDSASRRLTAAWLAQAPALTPAAQEGDDEDAAGTLGLQERLRRMDFAEMSADEWRAAQAQLLRMRQLTEWLPTRRLARAHRPGRPDWRATLAAMARRGGEADGLRWRRPRRVPAPVVVLADISGSMRRYARMLLHFAHALGRSGVPVESFVFGTRLTRITRQLAQRDPDAAVQGVVQAVPDWSGGTRIADSLHRFNRQWSRRVLGGRVTVLLITDGLEPGDPDALAFETERLRKQCRRLVWLNPLLRFDGFEPRARGIRAMLPHVDRFVPAHNLVSLAALVDGLMDAGRPAPLRSRSPVSAQDSAR
jgi:hypothetical protein